jgi:hypothetical protein
MNQVMRQHALARHHAASRAAVAAHAAQLVVFIVLALFAGDQLHHRVSTASARMR